MSTLRPGRVSKVIQGLRDAAIKEMDTIPEGKSAVKNLKFDSSHASAERSVNPDDDSWVGKFSGQNCPDVGNGSGGVR